MIDKEIIDKEEPTSLQAVKDKDDALVQKILQEDDVDNLKDLTRQFNVFQAKRQVLRVNTLNDVQDALVQQMLDRLEQQPHNFDNKDIALWVKTVQSAMESSKKGIEEVDTIPTIVHQNNTQINVNVEDTLSRESREKILSVLDKILGESGGVEDENVVLHSEGEIIPIDEVKEGVADDK